MEGQLKRRQVLKAFCLGVLGMAACAKRQPPSPTVIATSIPTTSVPATRTPVPASPTPTRIPTPTPIAVVIGEPVEGYDAAVAGLEAVKDKKAGLQKLLEYWVKAKDSPFAQQIDTGNLFTFTYYPDQADPENGEKVIVGFDVVDSRDGEHYKYLPPLINGEYVYEAPEIPEGEYNRDPAYGEVEVTAGERENAWIANYKGNIVRATGKIADNNLVIWEVLQQRPENPLVRSWLENGQITAESIGYHRNQLTKDFVSMEFGEEDVADKRYKGVYGMKADGKKIMVAMEVEPNKLWQASKYKDEKTGFKGVTVWNKSCTPKSLYDDYVTLNPATAGEQLYGTLFKAVGTQLNQDPDTLKKDVVGGKRLTFKVPTQNLEENEGWWVKWDKRVEDVDPRIMEIRPYVSHTRPDGLFENEEMVAATYGNNDGGEGYQRWTETSVWLNEESQRITSASWHYLTSLEVDSIQPRVANSATVRFRSQRMSLIDYAYKAIGFNMEWDSYYKNRTLNSSIGQRIFLFGFDKS